MTEKHITLYFPQEMTKLECPHCEMRFVIILLFPDGEPDPYTGEIEHTRYGFGGQQCHCPGCGKVMDQPA